MAGDSYRLLQKLLGKSVEPTVRLPWVLVQGRCSTYHPVGGANYCQNFLGLSHEEEYQGRPRVDASDAFVHR